MSAACCAGAALNCFCVAYFLHWVLHSTCPYLLVWQSGDIKGFGVHCCRWIKGTAVDPTVPEQCMAAGSIFRLRDIPDASQRQRLPLPAASLAALLLLAALVAGGALGRVLLHRKLRQRGSDCQQHGAHSALPRQRHSRTAWHTGAATEPATAGGATQPRKRARLVALVEAELDSANSQGIEMLPLDALPATLAHRMGSMRRHPPRPASTVQTSFRRGWSAPSSAAGKQHLDGEAQHLLAVPEEALLGSSGSQQPGHARPQSSSQLDGRQWGLNTQSLRVRPGDLQVRLHRF